MSIKKIVYIVLGCICLGIGAVGAVLPILPTTPFLLVAAFCFARSSERLNNWFKGTKLYKNNLENFVRGQGMDIKAKMRIMTTVTIIMAIAIACMYRVPIGQICVACVWVAHVIAFTFFIKTPKQIEKRNLKREAKRKALEATKPLEANDAVVENIDK